MDAERYRQARDLFLEVFELSPPERRELLDEHCAEDTALRHQVESLLEVHDGAAGATLADPNDSALNAPASNDPAPNSPRFRPGDLFAERYRIVSLLGEGGMGQVYRAEDETLGVTVAIKVLPDPGRGREPLLAEVRLAREVTHPAICRVHDVGEWQGEAFITMEYVAGEDLASLLRRIGRLPPDKVLDIARQLGAGLAAAHAHGVLHRDLKPGNILMDPGGRVRIADFGIAVDKDLAAKAPLAGTAGYLAPELSIPGRRASERSDLYALGVVLYELVTGRLPFVSRRAVQTPPANPSAHAPGLDRQLEQAILRCLEAEPTRRPTSALEVVASLPGADALSLAAEMEVTPSPEIVAAAGDDTALPRRTLSMLFALVLPCVALAAWLGEKATFFDQAGPLKAPQVLLERARDVAEAAGFERHLEGRRYGFLDDPRAESLEGSALFWVRLPLDRQVPDVARRYFFERPDGSLHIPQGSMKMVLDASGHLLYFEANPVPSTDPGNVDWTRLLKLAGDLGELQPSEPRGDLPVFAAQRLAWQSSSEERIEAASVAQRLVYFAVQDAPSGAAPSDNDIAQGRQALGGRDTSVQFFLVLVALAAIPLAWFHLQSRRGDLRGAGRLAGAVFVLFVLGWWLESSFPGHPMAGGSDLLAVRLKTLVQRCLWLVIGYLALEPMVRQIWPQLLIAWNRALEGRVRDVLVGQSLVVGSLAGLLFCMLDYLDFIVPGWMGFADPTAPLIGRRLNAALSPRMMLATACTNVPTAIYEGLIMLIVLLFFRHLLKSPRRALFAFAITLGALIALTSGGNLSVSWWVQGIPAVFVAVFAMRHGLLAYVVSRFIFYFLDGFPLTTDPELWYFEGTFYALSVVVALASMGLLMARRSPAGSQLSANSA